MLARQPTRSCDFKVINKMLISDIIGLQLFIAKIQGTQQCNDLEVGCVEGTKHGLNCQVYKRHSCMGIRYAKLFEAAIMRFTCCLNMAFT